MPTPISELMQLQAGTNDSDWGTVMALSSKLMGIATAEFTPAHTAEMLAEIRGTVHPGYVSKVNHVEGAAKISGEVTYEDFPYWLDAALGTSAVTADTESTRSWTASPDWASSDPQPKIFTLGYGSTIGSAQYVGMPGATLTKLVVKGETGANLTFDAEFFGKEVASSDGSLAALSDRAVLPVLGASGSLAIDVSSDAVGTTAVTATAFSFELTIDTKRAPVTHLGSLVPQGYKHGKFEADLKLVVEMTSDMVTLFNQVIDPNVTSVNAQRVVQLSFSVTSDATSDGTPRSLVFQFAGVMLEKPVAFGDKDGVVTAELMFKGIYNAVMGSWFKATSRNGVAVLP